MFLPCSDFSFLSGRVEDASESSSDPELRFLPLADSLSDVESTEDGGVDGLDEADDVSDEVEDAVDRTGDGEREEEDG